ncbi:hypothetical protein LTR85_010222 [Meristemomyces frigidus]|nr:hypothetical protein LTR85_010222 [Meristemomyces frigidus]
MAKDQIFPPPACLHDDCALCFEHFRPVQEQREKHLKYTRQLSDAQAGEVIRHLILQTTCDLNHVRAKLQSHGDLILTRWTKKSKEKRALVLSSAAPEVFGQWPQPPQSKDSADYERRPGDLFAPEDILPCVEQRYSICPFADWLEIQGFMEDRMKLLSLLHLRTEFPPPDWAVFDIRGTSFAFCAGWLPVPFNAKCVKMYGKEYGQLTDWSEWITHSWGLAGFPRAYLTFYAQRMIMSTLRALVDDIVGDAAGTGSNKWNILVRNGFRSSGCEALWGAYTNQAFAPPVLFDPHFMLRKAKARLDLVLDEFWLMQTEPAYTHHIIRHMSGSIVCDDVRGVRSDVRWNHIAMELMAEAINRLTNWRMIVTECQGTCDLFRRYESDIGPGRPLPQDANVAMVSLGTILDSRLKKQNYVFDKLLPSMRSFRDRFTAYQGDGNLQHRERQTMDPSDKCDRLYWIIDKLHRALQTLTT